MATLNNKTINKLDNEYASKISNCDSALEVIESIYFLLIELELHSTARELDALETRQHMIKEEIDIAEDRIEELEREIEYLENKRDALKDEE